LVGVFFIGLNGLFYLFFSRYLGAEYVTDTSYPDGSEIPAETPVCLQ